MHIHILKSIYTISKRFHYKDQLFLYNYDIFKRMGVQKVNLTLFGPINLFYKLEDK